MHGLKEWGKVTNRGDKKIDRMAIKRSDVEYREKMKM